MYNILNIKILSYLVEFGTKMAKNPLSPHIISFGKNNQKGDHDGFVFHKVFVILLNLGSRIGRNLESRN